MANWKILDMNHRTSDGYVVEVISACEKVDGQAYARRVFTNEFEGTPGSGYIPFDDLTEEVVLEWVKEAIGPEEVNKIELSVDAQAAAQKEAIENPPVKDGLPWV